jgi:hypothetical protein
MHVPVQSMLGSSLQLLSHCAARRAEHVARTEIGVHMAVQSTLGGMTSHWACAST